MCTAGSVSYELCPGGSDVLVDSSNLVQYIQGVVDATLGAGIAAQMQAFREGFNEVSTGCTISCCFPSHKESCTGWKECLYVSACRSYCLSLFNRHCILRVGCMLQVFTLSALEVFYEDELEVLLCGAGEHWSPQQLADSIKFDHGYTAQSIPVR